MAERAAYLRGAAARRRSAGEEAEAVVETNGDSEDANGEVAEVTLSDERIEQMAEAEELLLTVTNGGFGKRSSAYDYRVTGRGGQGIANITLSPRRNGTEVAATFPVRPGTDVMLVTDAGRLIRVPGDQVRITGRQAMGVTLFRLDEAEHVTAVFPVIEAVAELDEAGPLPESDTDTDTDTDMDGDPID